ncbi:nitrilase [Dysosmobacter sp. NSJ-60]|nr:nitrilase [Dysosmobacter hominis]
MNSISGVTKHEMIDALIDVSIANGIPAKYVKGRNFILNRVECARLCQEIFHLPDRPCKLSDVTEQSYGSSAIGAVLEAGLFQLEAGAFQGALPFTYADKETLLAACDQYLKDWRANLKPFQATALQFNPQMYQKEKNIARLYAEVEKAFANGSKLVVAPETSTSAYVYFDRAELAPYVEPVPGPATDHFSILTKKYHAYLSFGIAEVDLETGDFYNTAVLLGPEGYIGKYRKMHQWETEKHWGVDGDLGMPVFATELGNLAMIICIDASYYEATRLAAVNGADIMLYHTCDSGEAIWALPSRSIQNGLYMVSANRTEQEKGYLIMGGSSIWGPDGDKLAEGEITRPGEKAVHETEHVSAVIDPARFINTHKKRLFERRPECYKELRLNISPWDKRKSLEHHDVNALSVQFEPILGDQAANQEKILKLIEDAYAQDRTINLIVLPEMSVTGPISDRVESVKKAAEKVGGKTTAFFSAIAQKYKTAVVFTFVEKVGETLYHTAVVLENNGSILGTYRKIQLNQDEKLWASPGDRVESFVSSEIGRIGVVIGDEYLFPEIFGLQQIKRADLIAMPSAYVSGGGKIEANPRIVARNYPKQAVLLWDSLAIGTQAYLVVANYVGTEKGYAGGSGLYTLEPIYGKDQPRLTGTEEIGFVTRFETLAAETWWMNQEVRVITRKPNFYTPLTI